MGRHRNLKIQRGTNKNLYKFLYCKSSSTILKSAPAKGKKNGPRIENLSFKSTVSKTPQTWMFSKGFKVSVKKKELATKA